MFGKNKENIKFSDDILKKLQLLILDYNISLDNIVNEAYEIAGIEGASSVLATVNQSFIDLVDETKKFKKSRNFEGFNEMFKNHKQRCEAAKNGIIITGVPKR